MGRKEKNSGLCAICGVHERINRRYCLRCKQIVNKRSNERRPIKKFVIDELEGEYWKPIIGYEGLYEASNMGRIKATARQYVVNGISRIKQEQLLKLSVTNGYYKVNLRKNGRYDHVWVHRIIAATFIPNPDGKKQVNHKKGIRTDNRVEELEWVTYEENRRHAVRVLGHKWDKGIRLKGATHPQSKKVKQIDLKTGSTIKIWDSLSDIKRSTISRSVSACITGKAKTSGGFKWEYA